MIKHMIKTYDAIVIGAGQAGPSLSVMILGNWALRSASATSQPETNDQVSGESAIHLTPEKSAQCQHRGLAPKADSRAAKKLRSWP
jgi:hypothetical protein